MEMIVFDWSTIMIGPGSSEELFFFQFLGFKISAKFSIFFKFTTKKEKEIHFFFCHHSVKNLFQKKKKKKKKNIVGDI
jgi:hypothetical protein